MRGSALALAVLVACGGSNSTTHVDAEGADLGGDDGLGGGATTITVTLTNRPSTAATYAFVTAYQDGTGPWQLAPAPSGDTYTFTVNAPTWGFVWTCVPTNNEYRLVHVAYFTSAEKTS